ncbi:MAG: hypothetical protein PHI12_07000 [Dehalococcoidales bacterium]|nr:hypothetical protein [Dehalococcoidales bacterium]
MSDYDDAIFSIEVRRYDRAAEYMLKDVFGDKLQKMKPKQVRLLKQRLSKEIESQRNHLRQWQYSGRMSSEDRVELAREAYDRTYSALELDKYDDNILQL